MSYDADQEIRDLIRMARSLGAIILTNVSEPQGRYRKEFVTRVISTGGINGLPQVWMHPTKAIPVLRAFVDGKPVVWADD
jgi:hypothetical protein